MAGWISSRLKSAESFLQHIDQQAAEAAAKAHDHTVTDLSSNSVVLTTTNSKKIQSIPPSTPPSPSPSPLNLNLPKKPSRSPPPPPPPTHPPSTSSAPSPTPLPSAVSDADWTQLLNSDPKPKKPPIRVARPRPIITAIKDEIKHDQVVVENEKKADKVVIVKEVSRDDDEDESESGSASGSESSEDSEEERRREEEMRRRRAKRIVALAAKAIRDKEDAVAKLEGEKVSLEKVLAEREKEQAQEASELQTSMIETMEAVEIEKQKHTSTRMEALACLAKLEATNAELAKSLVTEQWNLEGEVDRVAKLWEQVDLKELAQEECKRNISKFRSSGPFFNEIESLQKFKLEEEIIDAEYTFTCDRIISLNEKARRIEENIELTRREMVHRTDVEIELKKRLDQLSDRLIQKQMQVEGLVSEKATLALRIETISRSLDENGSLHAASSKLDIEAGTWQTSYLPKLRDRMSTGQKQLGSAVRQLDSIFSAGHIFLRRNRRAQLWALLYVVLLHLWVMYILMSTSKVSESSSSRAIISLDSVNKTART